MWSHGTFYWNELMTRDVEKAKAFYGPALGWTFESMPMENGDTYHVCRAGDTMAGGIFPMSSPDHDGLPEHWFSYIAVDDIDDRIEKAKAGGGTVMRGPFDVPEIGRIAIVQDPSGAVMGWMTPTDSQ